MLQICVKRSQKTLKMLYFLYSFKISQTILTVKSRFLSLIQLQCPFLKIVFPNAYLIEKKLNFLTERGVKIVRGIWSLKIWLKTLYYLDLKIIKYGLETQRPRKYISRKETVKRIRIFGSQQDLDPD